MDNNNQTTVSNEVNVKESPTLDIPIKDSSIKKEPKKYNGFLRNHTKKSNKKPTPNIPLESNQIKKKVPKNNVNQSEITSPKIIEVKQTSEEYYIFNFLRLKSGHEESKFWDNLNKILKEKTFSDIKNSNLSLISYAVLNDSTIVFDKLLSQFGQQVTQQEFIDCVFKYAIHKNPHFMRSALTFYEQHFPIDNNFIENLVKDFSTISFRKETNDLFLSWTSNKINTSSLSLFWDNAIKHKNVPIILQSLQHTTYSQYLYKNIDNYAESLANLGRLNEIKRLLGDKKDNKKVDDLIECGIINKEIGLGNEQDFEPKIWLSNKSDQFKVIQEKLSDKKPTEVIVKRKRKIA